MAQFPLLHPRFRTYPFCQLSDDNHFQKGIILEGALIKRICFKDVDIAGQFNLYLTHRNSVVRVCSKGCQTRFSRVYIDLTSEGHVEQDL